MLLKSLVARNIGLKKEELRQVFEELRVWGWKLLEYGE